MFHAAIVVLLGISNGGPSTEPSTAAVIDADLQAVCSAIIIHSRVVLTTRSCAASAVEIYVGQALDESSVHGVATVAYHPDASVDMALLVIDPATNKRPAVLPGFQTLAIGDVMRMTGFGHTSDPASDNLRREGTAGIVFLTGSRIGLTHLPADSCDGDTGGGIFDNGFTLHGLITSTGPDCNTYIEAVRTTPFPDELTEFIQSIQEGIVPVGGVCYYPDHCFEGDCFQRSDGGFPYCSIACASADACPEAMVCEFDRCVYPVPSPGAVGWSCAANSDCYTELCTQRTEADDFICSQRCTPGRNHFPTGYTCVTDADERDACFPAPETGCGCQSGGDPGAVWLLVLVLAALCRRRGPSRCLERSMG